MNTFTQTINTSAVSADYKKILRSGTQFFLISSGILFLSYMYCVGAVTFTVLHRRSLEQELKLMTSDISRQELSFLNTQKTLTKEYAYSLGLVLPTHVAFTAPKRAVAFNAGF